MDDKRVTVTERLYVQKWPDAVTVAETEGVAPSEIVVLGLRTEDGQETVVEVEETITDTQRINEVRRRIMDDVRKQQLKDRKLHLAEVEQRIKKHGPKGEAPNADKLARYEDAARRARQEIKDLEKESN